MISEAKTKGFARKKRLLTTFFAGLSLNATARDFFGIIFVFYIDIPRFM